MTSKSITVFATSYYNLDILWVKEDCVNQPNYLSFITYNFQKKKFFKFQIATIFLGKSVFNSGAISVQCLPTKHGI